MKINMGAFDRTVRVLVTISLVVLFFAGNISGAVGYILLAIAVVFLLTSLTGICPLYSLFGFNTCQIKKPDVK